MPGLAIAARRSALADRKFVRHLNDGQLAELGWSLAVQDIPTPERRAELLAMVEQVKVPNRRVREGTRQPRPRTKTMTWTWSPNRTRRPKSASAQGNDLPR
jgi:hypothetical protein